METKVFLTAEVNGLPANSIHQMDAAEAHKLIEVGHAVECSTPELDAIERGINEKVDRFRKKIAEMKASDDPKYKVEGAIDYYTAQLQAELDSEVSELQSRYEGTVQGIKLAAKTDLANNIDYISDDARKAASDAVNEAIAAIKYGDAVGHLDVLISNVEYFGETRKLALLKELSRLAEVTNGHVRQKELDSRIKDLYQELNKVRENRLIPVKMANAMSSRGDSAYRILKMTHPSYKR